MKEDKLIQDWLSNEVSAKELAEMEKVIAFTEKLTIPENKPKADAWADILGKINDDASDNEVILVPEKRENRKWIPWVASIAAIFLMGYFGMLQMEKPSVYTTASTDTISHNLPDNSVVTLNSQSSISVLEDSWESDRKVRLEGEAFFEVEPGSKFTVVTDYGEVTVLGTSFNVYARPSGFEVTCKTGSVKVSFKESEMTLKPGYKAYYTEFSKPSTDLSILKTVEVSVNEIGAWREGNFYYDGINLQEVINEMERQFDIEIDVSANLSGLFYNGYFSKMNLTEALQLVFIPMGLTFEMEGNQVNVQ